MGYEIIEEVVSIGKLKPDPDNPNQMTEKQLKALAHSIQRFGELMPVLVDENYNIIDGEHRWKAMQLAGYDKIKVWIIKGAAEKDKRLIRQAMNKIRGTHDIIKDIKEFQRILELGGKDDLMSLLNLSEDDLATMLNELTVDEQSLEQELSELTERNKGWRVTVNLNENEMQEWKPVWETIPADTEKGKFLYLLNLFREVEGGEGE